MKGNQSFKLLEGSYNPETARQLILCCLNEQILYHNREFLRNKIYGQNTANIEKQIEELKVVQNNIKEYFKSNENSSNLFSVNSSFEIKISLELLK